MRLNKGIPGGFYYGVVRQSPSDPAGYCYHLRGLSVDIHDSPGLTMLLTTRRHIWHAVHVGFGHVTQVLQVQETYETS